MAFKHVAAVAGLAIAGIVGYVGWTVQAKRQETRALHALVADVSSGVAQSLKQPSPALAARFEAAGKSLEELKVSRVRPYAEAADVYIVSARTIAQRQADVARLSREAEEARNAFVAQLRTTRGRDGTWIRRTSELSRRMDQAYGDLARVQQALIDLLRTFPESEKQLVPFSGPGIVADPALHDAALKRAQADLKRAAEDAENVRRMR